MSSHRESSDVAPDHAPRLKYEEFDVRFESGDAGLQVRVLRSPRGTPTASLPWPQWLEPEQLEVRLAWLDPQCRSAYPGDPGSPAAQPGPPSTPTSRWGAELFDLLLPVGPVHDAFQHSLAWVAGRERTGLRLRLHFDLADPVQARLCCVPWELLYRSETREFLALDPRSPVVRCLDVPRLPRVAGPSSRWRVALSVPRPRGAVALDGCEERRLVAAELRRNPAVAIVPVQPASVRHLGDVLRRRRCNALHFIGHGSFDDESGDGCLLFEDEQGAPHFVRADVLATTLHLGAGLGFVFLNTCAGAKVPRRHGRDPFSGVASALVMSGVPVVLAMQFPISDEAALVFSRAFYAAVAAGEPLEAAVALGRVAILQALPDEWEWAIPALYMSTAAVVRPPTPRDRYEHERAEEIVMPIDKGPSVAPATPPTAGDNHLIESPQNSIIAQGRGAKIIVRGDEPQRQAALGVRALAERRYGDAERHLRAALGQGATDAAVRYGLALAVAAQAERRGWRDSQATNIEELLESVQAPAREHLVLRAAVKYAYYARNHQTEPAPTAGELLAEALTLPRRTDALHDLQRHIDLDLCLREHRVNAGELLA